MRKMKPILSWILAMALLFTNVEYVDAAQVADSGLVEEAENVFEEDEFGVVTGGDAFTEGTNAGEDVTEKDVTPGDAMQNDVTDGNGDGNGNEQDSVVEGTVLYSGEKGGITWQLTKDGVLTIAGEDTSKYWSYDHMPWLEHASLIKKAVVKAKNVKDTYRWFFQCENLESVDFRNFDTSSVVSMGFMFCCCEKLTSLDLSGFDTSIG